MLRSKKWAFWEYDLFPYLLWGEIGAEYSDNVVRIPSYDNSTFHAKLILSDKKAKVLIQKLETLKVTRVVMLDGLHGHLNAIMKEYGAGV